MRCESGTGLSGEHDQLPPLAFAILSAFSGGERGHSLPANAAGATVEEESTCAA